jgi:hypothetical protein
LIGDIARQTGFGPRSIRKWLKFSTPPERRVAAPKPCSPNYFLPNGIAFSWVGSCFTLLIPVSDRTPTSGSAQGSVATILAKDARRWWAGPDGSCGPVEQVGDKGGLAADIMTVNLSKLSLPHHRHGFETRQRSPRRTETAEAEPRPDKALDAPVVLLDDVVEVFTLSRTSAAR